MSFDRAKALEAAQKYLAKGQLDRAIHEYERLVQADPKDSRLLLKLGDLYTRQGAARDATTTYRKVAEQYAEQGFFLKAVAVCKQILKLDPNQTDIWERLAEMYEMLSLFSDAISTYEQVVEAHTRNGSLRKAVKALQKICDLDPDNIAARIRYAEALSKLNKPEEAAAAFFDGAELLKRQGRIEDYLKVGERLLFHQPDNDDFARSLASAYLERDNPKHALAKLQACFNRDPRNIETLHLLAQAFEQLGQTPKTISVLKEIARLHGQDERRTEQGSVLRKILALDPQDSEARRDLSEIRRLPTEHSSAAIEVNEDDYDLLLEDDESNLVEEVTGSGLLRTAPPPTGVQAEVAQLMEEYAVFVRYGLTDKMVTQLQSVLELDPHNIDAREKLKDALIKARRSDDAVVQLLSLAEQVSAHSTERAEEYLAEAIRLDPNNEQAKRRLAHIDNLHAGAHAQHAAPTVPPPDGQATYAGGAMGAEVVAYADHSEEIEEDLTDEALLDDDEVIFVDEDEDTAVEVDHERGALHGGHAAGRATAASKRASEPAPLAVAEEDLPEPLRDAIDEINFYMSQEMPQEALSTLQDTLESFGEHPALLALQGKLLLGVDADSAEEVASQSQPDDPSPARTTPPGQIRSRLGTTPGIAAPPAPPEPGALPFAGAAAEQPRPDRSFELAQKLAEEVVPQTNNSAAAAIEVADVLAQFKQGVAKQVEQTDAATHYDLGIAYVEMGLHGEAIDEFKLCLVDPERRCTAHTMIGLSYVAKGEMDQGIEHMQRALDDNPKPEEELALWFELGNACELLGKNPEALVWYEKVEERDAGYRDVAQRIERLGTTRTPEEEADEFDEMFDNMILKD